MCAKILHNIELHIIYIIQKIMAQYKGIGGQNFEGCVPPLDQEYIDRARPIFLLSFSCFIQQLLMSLINLSGKFKIKAMI